MKTQIYILLTLLAIIMPTATLRSEEVTGTSDPFVFGTPAATVPLSLLPLFLLLFLFGLYIFLRYNKVKNQIA